VDIVLDLAGGNLAVVRGQGDDLVAGGLDGAGLVAVDVSARGGENALPRAQDRGDHGCVRLCAAGEKVNIRIRRIAGRADPGAGRRTVFVLAIADGLHHVRLGQTLHNLGMGALEIIAVEVDHGKTLLSSVQFHLTTILARSKARKSRPSRGLQWAGIFDIIDKNAWGGAL
jgi:hypothetical protein